MKRVVLIFSGIAIALFFLFKLSSYTLSGMATSHSLTGWHEWLVVILGCFFILTGVLIYHLVFRKVGKEPTEWSVNQRQLKASGISKREYEILLLLANGQSNSEIGRSLHISENTVKTHVSNILSKLNAQRRTQAVRIARQIQILPP